MQINKKINLSIAHTAELVAQRKIYSSITYLVAAKFGISIKRARQIISNAYLLLKNDNKGGDLNHPKMKAKLLHTLVTGMHRSMKEKQY